MPGPRLLGTHVRYDADRDAWLVHRPARTWPVLPTARPHQLPTPPADLAGDSPSLLTTLVPLLGSLGIVGFAVVSGSVAFLVVAGFMVVAVVGGTLATRIASSRRTRRRAERRRAAFTEAVQAAAAASDEAGQQQRDALLGLYPETSGLLTAVQRQGALWERRPVDDDFASVRLGLGQVRALAPVLAASGVDTDAELTALAEAAAGDSGQLQECPVVLPLRTLSSLAVVGPLGEGRELVGSWVASLAATCAPTDLRILGLVPSEALADWDWAKWLPHVRDPLSGDGFGRASRALGTEPTLLAEALTGLVAVRRDQQRRATEQGGWRAAGGSAVVAGEHVLVILDDYDPVALGTAMSQLDVLLSQGSQLAVTVVILCDDAATVPTTCGARVDLLADGTCRFREAGPSGRCELGVQPDRLDRDDAERLARLLCPLWLVEADVGADLVDVVRLVELLGYDQPEQLHTGEGWLTPADLFASVEEPEADVPQRRRPTAADLLRVPVGLLSDGNPLLLDLKEAALGGTGPHGMLVGATGSGKSELLRSLVVGLAAGHSPELLTMLLIDFKGGATFADLQELPHTAGLITNLADDLTLVDRMRTSLAGELERRQQLLRDAGNLESIHAYQELRYRQPELPALPYLLVVVDEFGELLAARPEFLEVFVAIGRLGRSLGIHLLLATQRLEEGRIRGLESHLRYRLCLRTYSAAESVTVLGVPDAHTLPPMPGLGYLRADNDLMRFKAATTSLPHRPQEGVRRAPAVTQPFGLSRQGGTVTPESGEAGRSTELRVLIDRLGEAPVTTARQTVWLPPLPDVVDLVPLLESTFGHGVPVGLVDDPARQRQDPLLITPAGGGGHVACVGAPRTGRTSFLRAVAASLATGRSAAEVSVYVLDLGGGGLHDLAVLPHVGAVAGRHDPDSISRLLRELRVVTEERAAAFRRLGVTSLDALRRHPEAADVLPDPLAADLYLLVDNAGVLRSEFPELDLLLSDLAGTSLQFGVHLVLTAGRWLDLRPALLDAVQTRVELRLNDPADSLAGRRVAETLPEGRPGRGLLRDGRHVQLALAGDVGWITAPDAHRAPQVRPLPDTVHVDDIDIDTGDDDETGGTFCLGLREFRLAPQPLDLAAPGGHLLVFGDDGSGRTTLLDRALHHLEQGPLDVRIHLVDMSRGLLSHADHSRVQNYAFTGSLAAELAHDLAGQLLDRLPPPDVDRAALRDRSWRSGPDHYLIVDDYDLLLTGTSGPLGILTDALGHAADIGLHVLLARRVAGAGRSAFEPFGQRLRELSPTAIILDGDRGEGPLVGDRTAVRQPPGRGFLLQRRQSPTLMQLALPCRAVVGSAS